MPNLSLIIGSIAFSHLEIPQKIGPLGGFQSLCIHHFAGGMKTIDSLGAFPNTLTWSGIFTGPFAFSRAFQLDRLRATSQVVTLTYGPQAFSGKVWKFDYNPAYQFLIPYNITFEPIEDLSGIGMVAGGGISPDELLSDQTGSVDGIVSGEDGIDLPPSLSGPAGDLSDSVDSGLLDGNGTVDGISTADAGTISTSVDEVQTATAPLIAGIDPLAASAALDLAARAACIAAIVASPQTPARKLRMINPNLFAVAGQYLGDSALWMKIASASGLPPDPQPIGAFTIVVPSG